MPITRRRHVATPDGHTASATPVRRVRSWRRVGHGALMVAAGTAALSLAGPFALRPFVDAAHAAGAAGEIPVAFVLDFGGSSNTVVVGCVNVPSTTSRYQALSSFIQQEGLAQPVYGSSGLLCSINNVPATGCGQVVNGRYIYWSYFTGSGNAWVYSNTGAFSTVSSGDVEGWRFQDPGAGNPSDPAPRNPARYSSICGSTTPTTTTQPAIGGGGSPPTTTPTSTGGPGTTHAHAHAAAAAGGAASAKSTAGSSTTTSTSAASTAVSAPESTTNPTHLSVNPTSLPVPTDPELANARHAEQGSGGPGSGPLIIGGLLIVALGVAGYLRWRKRPHAP